MTNQQILLSTHAKARLRKEFRQHRMAIGKERRLEARRKVENVLTPIFENYRWILSYYPLFDELDTSGINHFLALQGKLLLPKVCQNGSLRFFSVTNLAQQVRKNQWQILEPDDTTCKETVSLENSLILVPGIAFDVVHQRLGFGKGHYDRFLSAIPNSIPTIGIGFQEQLVKGRLPVDITDIPLRHLLLF